MIKIICLLFSFLGSVGLLGNNIEMQLVHQSTLASEPGKIINFSIVLINKGANPTKLRPQLELPTGWKTITKNASFSLQAGAKDLQIITFVVPAKALAGTYEIVYRLIDTQNPSIEYSKKTKISVSATNKLEVIPLTASSTVLAGTIITGQFLVKNNSNQNQTILLTTRNAKIKEATTLELPAFSSRKVEVEAMTLAETREETSRSIHLKATLMATEISEIGHLQNQIIPSKYFDKDTTRRLPGYASLNYLHRQFGNGRKGQGWQGELFLQGAINEEKTQEVTLSLRGPNQQANTELTLYDQYYATYKNKSFSVMAGDYSYALSNLTEYARNGRGIQAEGYFGTATIGAFYVKPRFFAEINQEIGVFIQNEFTEKTSLRFNYLHKAENNNKGNASVMSISGQFNPFKNTIIEVEAASGNSGNAFYATVNTKLFDRLYLNSNFIYASPNFAGYFKNTLNLIGHLDYQLSKKVSLTAGVLQNSKNAALDTLFVAAPFTDRKHIGLRMKLARNAILQFNLRQNEIEDRLPQKQFFRKENLLTATFNHKISRFNYSLATEYGESKNFLQSAESDFRTIFRTYLDVEYNFGHFAIRAFGQYFNTNSLWRSTQKQLLFGGTISGEIKERFQFKIRYQNDFETEVYYKNRNAFDCFLMYRIRKNQQFLLNARQIIQRNTINNRDFFFSAKYIYQFGIRLEAKPSTGNVYGQILRSHEENAKGIIVLLNGKTAITDAEGRFRFKKMRPGKYPIMLDPSTLSLHEMLADSAMPIVEVLPEVNQAITLNLIQSGAILGGIEFKKAPNKAQLISLETLGNLMLEVSNGKEIRRTFTNESGQYKFGDLKPGIWKVKVLKSDLDKNLKIAKTNFTIDIQEGKTTYLPIIIHKKRRTIQFKRLKNLSDDDDD